MEQIAKSTSLIAEANKAALAQMQELTRKQGEILALALKNIKAAVGDSSCPEGAIRDPAQIGEITQKALDLAFGNMRDLAMVLVNTQSKAVGVLNDRILNPNKKIN